MQVLVVAVDHGLPLSMEVALLLQCLVVCLRVLDLHGLLLWWHRLALLHHAVLDDGSEVLRRSDCTLLLLDAIPLLLWVSEPIGRQRGDLAQVGVGLPLHFVAVSLQHERRVVEVDRARIDLQHRLVDVAARLLVQVLLLVELSHAWRATAAQVGASPWLGHGLLLPVLLRLILHHQNWVLALLLLVLTDTGDILDVQVLADVLTSYELALIPVQVLVGGLLARLACRTDTDERTVVGREPFQVALLLGARTEGVLLRVLHALVLDVDRVQFRVLVVRLRHVLALQLLLLVDDVGVHLVDLVATHLLQVVLALSDLGVAVGPDQVLDGPVVDVEVVGISDSSLAHLRCRLAVLLVLVDGLGLQCAVGLSLIVRKRVNGVRGRLRDLDVSITLELLLLWLLACILLVWYEVVLGHVSANPGSGVRLSSPVVDQIRLRTWIQGLVAEDLLVLRRLDILKVGLGKDHVDIVHVLLMDLVVQLRWKGSLLGTLRHVGALSSLAEDLRLLPLEHLLVQDLASAILRGIRVYPVLLVWVAQSARGCSLLVGQRFVGGGVGLDHLSVHERLADRLRVDFEGGTLLGWRHDPLVLHIMNNHFKLSKIIITI